jgi:hypothetical protein
MYGCNKKVARGWPTPSHSEKFVVHAQSNDALFEISAMSCGKGGIYAVYRTEANRSTVYV